LKCCNRRCSWCHIKKYKNLTKYCPCITCLVGVICVEMCQGCLTFIDLQEHLYQYIERQNRWKEYDKQNRESPLRYHRRIWR
jgi:hypothetical protein